jgi:hypothetical protein
MTRLLSSLAVLTCLFGTAGRVSAGWVTIKNETTQPVMVQETTVVNNQVRRGKPIKLMPGDEFREYQSAAGSKIVQVLEWGGAKRTLCRGELTWQTGDESFAVRKSGAAVKVVVTPAVTDPSLITAADRPRKK